MGTINPRARGGPSFQGDQRKIRDDLQQQRRLRSTLKQQAASSGGMSGIRWRAYGTVSNAGATASRGIAMNWDPANSGIQPVQLGPANGPEVTYAGDGSFTAASAGFYEFQLTAVLYFAADPGKVYLSWSGGAIDQGQFITQTWEGVNSSGVIGQLQARDSYRQYLAEGESMKFGWAWDNLSTCQVSDGWLDIFSVE